MIYNTWKYLNFCLKTCKLSIFDILAVAFYIDFEEEICFNSTMSDMKFDGPSKHNRL